MSACGIQNYVRASGGINIEANSELARNGFARAWVKVRSFDVQDRLPAQWLIRSRTNQRCPQGHGRRAVHFRPLRQPFRRLRPVRMHDPRPLIRVSVGAGPQNEVPNRTPRDRRARLSSAATLLFLDGCTAFATQRAKRVVFERLRCRFPNYWIAGSHNSDSRKRRPSWCRTLRLRR